MGAGRASVDRHEAWEAIRRAGGRVAIAADDLGIPEADLRQLLWGESQGPNDVVAVIKGGSVPKMEAIREDDIPTERVDVPALDITKLGLPEK